MLPCCLEEVSFFVVSLTLQSYSFYWSILHLESRAHQSTVAYQVVKSRIGLILTLQAMIYQLDSVLYSITNNKIFFLEATPVRGQSLS